MLTPTAITVASAASSEPGLKPNQPSHRMKTPRIAKGMLWPGIAAGPAVGVVLAEAWAEEDGAHHRGQPAAHVHDARAGEVGVDGIADR